MMTDEQIEQLMADNGRLMDENTRIRAALAQSELPCVYCSLPVEDWNKCQSGFPGCARSDDTMGCPELGASYALHQAKTEIQLLTNRLDGEMSVPAWRRLFCPWLCHATAKENDEFVWDECVRCGRRSNVHSREFIDRLAEAERRDRGILDD